MTKITIERQLVERAVSALTNEFPPTQLITALRAALAAQPAAKCWCESCDMAANVLRTRMSVCPKCGDKRCPRAKHHDSACRAAQPAKPVAHADYPCRADGRCQYAIDSGVEDLGHCPAGKCVMPPAPAAAQPAEPVAWAMPGGYASFISDKVKRRHTSPSIYDEYSIPLYAAPAAVPPDDAAELAQWRKLRDPGLLHANLIRGLPAQLSREQCLHLAGGAATPAPAAVPPLPEPVNFSDVQLPGNDEFNRKNAVYGYTADQMREYAAAAVAQERERCAKVCDDLAKDGVNDTRNPCGTCAAAIRNAT